MLAEERKRKILEMVNSRKIVKVNELSQILDTTEVTIRKDGFMEAQFHFLLLIQIFL